MKNNLFLLSILLSLGFSVKSQIGKFSDPLKMGPEINTEAEELMPVFSPDSSTIYFSRALPNGEKGEMNLDIWSSSKNGAEFKKAEPIILLNNKSHNAVVGMNKDGSTIYLMDSYDKMRSGDKKNYYKKGCATSLLKGKDWQEATHLDIPTLDIEGDAYGFTISNDETVMIISYLGPNSLGLADLYVSTKQGTNWSAPIHMGSSLNTIGDEFSPFLSSTKDTLFFSSDGLGGEGGVDIFYSVKQGSWTEWSTPVNVGTPINTPKFDAYFVYSPKKVYWASNRDGETSDIYSATILPPPPVEISCSGVNVTKHKGSDGKIDLTVSGGVPPYVINWSNGVSKEDPENLIAGSYTVIITDKIGQTAECTSVINEPPAPITDLTPLLVGLKPIYFDKAKYNIRKDAALELDKIVEIMNRNPEMEIELGSHTDCQSSEEYNMILSANRAKASAMYIKERITKPERINGRGYGESRPIVKCDCEGTGKEKCSEKENKMNRRTEFVLRKEGDEKYEDISTFEGGTEIASTPSKGNKKDSKKDSKKENSTSSATNTATPTTGELVAGSTKYRTDIPVTEEQAKNIANGFYILNEGETLWRVYKNTGVPLADLRRINDLKSNDIKPGTKLLLK